MSESPFARFFARQGYVVLDGGSATALEARGHALEDDLWSARLIFDAPDDVRAVHRAFLDAGADCVTTVGYQASFEALARRGLDERRVVETLRASVRLALEAKEAFLGDTPLAAARLEPIVAASAGPYGAYLADGSEYGGRYGVARAVLLEFHVRRYEVLADSGADLVAFETVPALDEAEVIADIMRQSDTSAWVAFTCRDGRHLRDGATLREAIDCFGSVRTLAGVGVNCTHPRHVDSLLREAAAVTRLPLIAYPNSGEAYDVTNRSWTSGAERRDWAADAQRWAELGARVVGGCCRVGAEDVRAIRGGLEAWTSARRPLPPPNDAS